MQFKKIKNKKNHKIILLFLILDNKENKKKMKLVKKIRIATRGSHLALAQTEYVAQLLHKLKLETEIVIIKTTGDINYSSFQEISKKGDEAKGLFTKEIEEALLRKEADIAVHSLKDLPTKSPDELIIAAIPQRLDFRDYFVFRKDKKIKEVFPFIKDDGIIGTSSFRRKSLIRFLYPSLRFMDIRGNVPTRIKKLFIENGPDAILLSGAGIQRLMEIKGWIEEDILSKIEIIPLDAEFFPPAPGQGTLAVQCRKEDKKILEILQKIHNKEIEDIISIERGVLAKLEGGCHLPLGIYAFKKEDLYYAKLFLGKEYPYGKKNKDFYILRSHKDKNKLIEFLYEELTIQLPIVIFGKKEKNFILKSKFKNQNTIFFDIMEVNYYKEFIKKIYKINLNKKFNIFCIFSAEGIGSLKKNNFNFINSNDYILVNGEKSKNILLENFPEIKPNQILLSEDGTSSGLAKIIQTKFKEDEVQIYAITAKESRKEFFEILHNYAIEQWIVYETITRTLTKEEISEIPKKAYLIFGSPSIFDAFFRSFEPLEFQKYSEDWRLITLGKTTFRHILNFNLSVYGQSIEPDYEMVINEFL